MTRPWRRAGKNVAGHPGLAWDIALYVPLGVLMVVKPLHARDMAAYLAETVVARVCIGRQNDLRPPMRDHSNIARAYAALGQDGIEEVNALRLPVARDWGVATDKYGFNKPKERLWQTLEMAGLRSILSFHLNKLMRDLVRAAR
jgi:hypothetical protein